jgi:hypothetical protein
MNSLSLELKQVACMNTKSTILTVGAETERFSDFKPTKRYKVIQKVGIDLIRGKAISMSLPLAIW